MNKKQLITMWVGIVVMILLNLFYLLLLSSDLLMIENFVVAIFALMKDYQWLIAIVTVGLMLTFADKKPKDE